MKRFILLFMSIFLTGCATKSPFTTAANLCDFKKRSYIVDDPGLPSNRKMESESDLPLESPTATLVLSGGNQNGAFGAGFLKGWADKSPERKLPEFGLVTGISTGAILGTWAFIREPDTVYNEYLKIAKEADLLKVYSKPSKDGKIGIGTATTLLRKNALADLDPLREKLRTAIGYETLKKVASQKGRFVVGAVEVDTGQMYMFDMKKMADTAYRARDEDEKDEKVAEKDKLTRFYRYRDCYVDAIMASSSAPIGAKPVFIDNRMYIDGGARHGVFVDYLTQVSRNARGPNPASGMPRADNTLPDAPTLFILINGTQWTQRQCAREGGQGCDETNYIYPDTTANNKAKRKDWNIADLAFRSNDILSNQVYRLSAARVETQYKEAYPLHQFTPHYYFARMHRTDLNEPGKFSHEIDGRKLSCKQWSDEDDKDFRPLQFHVRYMKCLMAYGEWQAREEKWYDLKKEAKFEAEKFLE